MSRVIIACIGGFLGAGKTTAIQRAIQELKKRGLAVGVITNDQGNGLVDTQVLEQLDVPTKEIAAGCFCCKFEDLVAKAQQILSRWAPDIILAEAVGSCTDLAATVYQPLRKFYSQRYDLAPLTILVEPARMRLFTGQQDQFPETVRYLFKKQLAEADLILVNKSDTLDEAGLKQTIETIKELNPDVPVRYMSALRNTGVAAWVDMLLTKTVAGKRTLNIDYGKYAQAEAALGWLNASLEVSSSHEFLPKDLAESLVRNIQNGLGDKMSVAHLKILVAAGNETNRIALTEKAGRPQWSGPVNFQAVRKLSVTINARIGADPQQLSSLVENSIASSAEMFGVQTRVDHFEAFSPLPPVPRYRIEEESAVR